MSPLEERVINQFVEAATAIDGVDTDLAAALRAELTAEKGPNAEKLAALIRSSAQGSVA